MRLKISLIFLFLSLFLSFHISAKGPSQTLDTFLNNTTDVNNYLQENEILIPSVAKNIIKDGEINVIILRINGDITNFYTKIDNGRITEISTSFSGKISYDIITDEETINNIINLENVSDALLLSYNQGKIKIKAHGIGNNIKLFLAKLFLKSKDITANFVKHFNKNS